MINIVQYFSCIINERIRISAPEIASGQPYDHSVDWWCLGVIMHLLLTGHYPFPPAQDHLTKRYPDYEPGQSLSPEMQTLLRKLLANDEQLRISSLNSLRALPIFGQYQIDFTRIQERQVRQQIIVLERRIID